MRRPPYWLAATGGSNNPPTALKGCLALLFLGFVLMCCLGGCVVAVML
jgi:hypothetical protein